MNTLLQINTVGNYLSTGRIAEEIGQISMESGWKSYIAFGRHKRPSRSRIVEIGTFPEVLYHALQTRLCDREGLASQRATRQFVKRVCELEPDIIHLHNLHGYYINLEILFSYLARANTPVVWTFHDCWPLTGHCTHFDYIGCERWKTECYNCPQKKRYPNSYGFDRSKKNHELKRKLFNSVNNLTIVTVSEWLRSIVSQSYLSVYPVEVINSGIDMDKFGPAFSDGLRSKYGLKDEFIILGVAGYWSDRKGLPDFIKLAGKLGPGHKVMLVGLNKNMIRQLPPNVIGITRTENIQELAQLYAMADVFVNPTLEDNFPTTNIEALACGTPVITYRTGGSLESVTEETGIIVEKGNVSQLLDAISIIREKGKAAYSGNCLIRARSLYDKKDRYADYVKLYNRLLSANL